MKTVKIGDTVKFFDEQSVEHNALVTCVHGISHPATDGHPAFHPAVNLLFVTDDASKTDVYGNQIERRSSICHGNYQQAHGFYWVFAD